MTSGHVDKISQVLILPLLFVPAGQTSYLELLRGRSITFFSVIFYWAEQRRQAEGGSEAQRGILMPYILRTM